LKKQNDENTLRKQSKRKGKKEKAQPAINTPSKKGNASKNATDATDTEESRQT